MLTFIVVTSYMSAMVESKNTAFLVTDDWNDWFRFRTMFTLVVYDSEGERHKLGSVKIGQDSMPANGITELPPTFDRLAPGFFSLGQDESYYEGLAKLDPVLRQAVVEGLNDIVGLDNLWATVADLEVTTSSLLRSVSRKSIFGQFRRILNGGAKLTTFGFRFQQDTSLESPWTAPLLDFLVHPESMPPSNVHVLIGRNGVGKSHTLYRMAQTLTNTSIQSEHGRFQSLVPEHEPESVPFANVVTVSFSAFDSFPPISVRSESATSVRYTYIGLTRGNDRSPAPGVTLSDDSTLPKTPEMLADEFESSVKHCYMASRIPRWRRALELLEADPLFRSTGVSALAGTEGRPPDAGAASNLFRRLSSGHKIVLLTITRLVESVEEKTLILADEPESHLHPPLLSAFVRALSDLLINRNGVAIVATHSPVILQEVPRHCVWILRRTGHIVCADRPELETFGENVGVLTREVFRLDVTHSGFHRMLVDASVQFPDFEAASGWFGNALGAEARAILQSIYAAKQANNGAQ